MTNLFTGFVVIGLVNQAEPGCGIGHIENTIVAAPR